MNVSDVRLPSDHTLTVILSFKIGIKIGKQSLAVKLGLKLESTALVLYTKPTHLTDMKELQFPPESIAGRCSAFNIFIVS